MANVDKVRGFDMNPPIGEMDVEGLSHCDAAILANRFGLKIELNSNGGKPVYYATMQDTQYVLEQYPSIDLIKSIIAEGSTRVLCRGCNNYQDYCTGACPEYDAVFEASKRLVDKIQED